jgi:predicted RNase H-like HicB family nuclease
MKYHFRVHKEEGKYWAECVELDGCYTDGNTLEELKQNAVDSLTLFLDEPNDSTIEMPLPNENVNGEDIIPINVPIENAFGIVLRNYRLSHKLSQSIMAQRLGIKYIYGYQRLEKKANPTLSMIKKIIDEFPDFPIQIVLE